MPYIKKEQREKFKIKSSELPSNKGIDLLQELSERCDNYGDLNYSLTVILKQFAKKKGECYDTYNSIIGMLECCKLEMYRKDISDYEDIKEKENPL